MSALPLPLVLIQAPRGVRAPLAALRQGFEPRRPILDWPCPPEEATDNADLGAALDALDAPAAVVLAWSIGAPFALDLVRAHADRVRAWVLVSPTWGAEGRTAWRAAFLGAVAWRARGRATRGALEAAGLGHLPGPSLAARVLRGTHLMARATPADAIQDALAEIAATEPARIEDLLARAASVPMQAGPGAPPLLVLTGQRDRICPPRRATRLADAFPGAELHVARDASHGLPLEYPEWTVLRTEKFLRDRSIP